MEKLTFLVFGTLLINYNALASSADSETQIREIIEKFSISIINKDKEVFSSLFFSDDIPFVAVFTKEMLEKKRLEKPNYPAAVDFSKFGSPVKMLSGDDEEEEKIWNIKIESDDYLASVHFNYSDYVNEKKRAWGTESWSMIKVDTDWKITSVSFTVTEIEN